MAVCVFFGHRNTPEDIKGRLAKEIERLITQEGVSEFLVGNNGQFDAMAKTALRKMKERYPYINYSVVLAYIPGEKKIEDWMDYSESLYPDCLDGVPPKFAIAKRNEWMVTKADYVIAYVRWTVGGAAKYVQLAERRGKKVINLASFEDM